MGILQSLFSSATAFVKGDMTAAKASLTSARVSICKTIGKARKSEIGRELSRLIDKGGEVLHAGSEIIKKAVKGAYRGAKEGFEEAREYEEKRARDGGLTEADEQRVDELRREREQFREEITNLKAELAAGMLRTEHLIEALLSSDELSANTGLLATKNCPECGGTMRIRQGGWQSETKQRNFWWECASNLGRYRCRTISIKLREETLDVIRTPNPDLDGDAERRYNIWKRPAVLEQTHKRLQMMIGETDDDLMCPIHVLPMRLVSKPRPGGHLLDSYEYACTGNVPGRLACGFVIPLETFPQVASLLRRKTTRGIIDGIVEF